MPTFLPKTLFLTALCCGQIALANDGFYQGGGSSLRPLENIQMRVIEEQLLIQPLPEPVCYHLRFRGRTLDAWNLTPTGAAPPLKAEEFATVADPTHCTPSAAPLHDRLLSLWQAQAEYQVEALADQESVQMGFPLPTWESTYYLNPDKEWDALPTPAVANFRTFIDGKLVENPRLTWLEVSKPGEVASDKTLGFTWRASFKKGRKYTLRTEYDFGADYSADFYLGQEYREGEDLPWFITPPVPKETVSHPAISLRYYLSPLHAWGAHPPKRITIEIRRPPGVPIAYLVPVMPKPACVDAYSLHYEYRDAYPDSELVVSMPQWFASDDWGEPKHWPQQPETPEQWQRWRQTLGESACVDMDGMTAPAGVNCDEQCSANEIIEIEPSIMLPRFEDFSAVVRYTGTIAAPDVKSQPKARMFRTRLRKAAREGVNFAGRYILASWGCGSGCQDAGIIDAKTGKVYFSPFIDDIAWQGGAKFNYAGGPPEGLNGGGTDFRSDSRLLFASGAPTDWDMLNALSVLLWDGHALKPLYIAYGSILEYYDESYDDINYGYYARLNREYGIDWMLEDALYRGGEQAAQRVAELLANPAPFRATRDRKIARAANVRGLEALQKDDLATAAQAFEEGAQADGKDVEVLNNLGYVYLLQGKLEEAEEQLRATLLLDPRRVSGWINLGQVFAAQNHSGKASAGFTLALRLSSKPGKTLAFLRKLANNESLPTLRAAVEKTLDRDWVNAISNKGFDAN